MAILWHITPKTPETLIVSVITENLINPAYFKTDNAKSETY